VQTPPSNETIDVFYIKNGYWRELEGENIACGRLIALSV
jgi:hypothetical protein